MNGCSSHLSQAGQRGHHHRDASPAQLRRVGWKQLVQPLHGHMRSTCRHHVQQAPWSTSHVDSAQQDCLLSYVPRPDPGKISMACLITDCKMAYLS